MAVSNEQLMEVILDTRAMLQSTTDTLDAHVKKEEPVIDEAKILIEMHGDKDAITARIAFVNAWMEREKDRRTLRKAVIEKTIVGALVAVIVYVGAILWQDMVEIVRGVGPHVGGKH